jgi:hypothetical protein
MAPRITDTAWSAEVRGTWRRIDQVQVEATRSHLVTSCSCGTAGLCSHAGAVLLHWLRRPDSFEIASEAVAIDAISELPGTPGHVASPTELSEALHGLPLEHLRQIARARGVRLTARSRADAVAQLAQALAEPANIDAALDQLRPAELLTLRVSYLVADGSTDSHAVQAGFKSMGGSGQAPLGRLRELGLLVDAGLNWHGKPEFKVPRSVWGRLPAWSELTPRAEAVTPRPAAPHAAGLDILELLAILSIALKDGLPARAPRAGHVASIAFQPGWEIGAPQSAGSNATLQHDGRVATLTAVSLVRDQELATLAARTGASREAVDFGVRLLEGLGLVSRGELLKLRDERWQAFEARSAEERRAALCEAWLSTKVWSELEVAAGPDGPFRLRGRSTGALHREPLLTSYVASLRRLSARCVGLLPADVWYTVPAFVATLEGLGDAALPQQSSDYWVRETFEDPDWWLVERTQNARRLMLNEPAQRLRVDVGLVAVLLQGPLAWLGLVDVVSNRDGPRAFRVRPSAAVLTGRPVVEQPSLPVASIVVGSDASVLVPPGATQAGELSLLTRVAEFVGGSAKGLRYRLSADRVQTAFDDGLSGAELLRFLDEHAAKPLPASVRERIERWWAGYGRVRLYDEVSLVELSDQVLPEEVLAAVPTLREHQVYAVSPRLLAIRPPAADAVIDELARLGYAPHVEQGGSSA